MRRFPAFPLVCLAAALAASGCVGGKAGSCDGIPGVATVTLNRPTGGQSVSYGYVNVAALVAHNQCRAQRGSKPAQLVMGRLYETGVGVPKDLARAASLYAQAAQSQPDTIALYSPPVTKGGAGQVIRVPNPNASPGLAEAKYRLGRMYLEGRGVERDAERGLELIAEATKQGYRLPGRYPPPITKVPPPKQ